MNITPAILLQLVLQYGPSVVGIVAKLVADIQAGRGQTAVTQADWDELTRLSSLTAESIYARLGITPPPSSSAPTPPAAP